jgi:hypothetical protein
VHRLLKSPRRAPKLLHRPARHRPRHHPAKIQITNSDPGGPPPTAVFTKGKTLPWSPN